MNSIYTLGKFTIMNMTQLEYPSDVSTRYPYIVDNIVYTSVRSLPIGGFQAFSTFILRLHLAFIDGSWNPSWHCDHFGSSLGRKMKICFYYSYITDLGEAHLNLQRLGFWLSGLRKENLVFTRHNADGLLFRSLRPMSCSGVLLLGAAFQVS